MKKINQIKLFYIDRLTEYCKLARRRQRIIDYTRKYHGTRKDNKDDNKITLTGKEMKMM